jgi:Major Facilitator Superfamily
VPRRDSNDGDRPLGRFSRSGHTSHYDRDYRPLSEQPTTRVPPSGDQRQEQFDRPSYHDTRAYENGAPPTEIAGKQTVTRAVVGRSSLFARTVTNKVIAASKADGADESGLTALIWNQVLSYGTDAMITVALAGTVFFGASTNAQRGNVLLYLLVTMAPFAVVAPIIGPALDRLQHGRRWAMAGTAIGRAALALVMAGHPTNLLVLYPCALGSLVLSKAYSVIRAAAAPRLVPEGMTLVEANARLSIFGLAAALIGGGFVGIVIKLTGSYTVGLIVTAIAFAVCAFFAFKLPKQVDSANPAQRHPEEPVRPRTQEPVPPVPPIGKVGRLGAWAKRGFAAQVITSMQGESTLRFLSGFLTIFLAFYIESTRHGGAAALALGGIALGAGAGNFVGTGIGARLKFAHPELLIIIGCATAAVACILTATLFSLPFAIACMFIASVVNSLSKIALDAVVQRDVTETLRSSAFARSETFLQLAWVLGAAVGVLLPSKDGSLGFWVAAVVVGAVTIVVALRNRAMRRATPGARGRSPRVT